MKDFNAFIIVFLITLSSLILCHCRDTNKPLEKYRLFNLSRISGFAMNVTLGNSTLREQNMDKVLSSTGILEERKSQKILIKAAASGIIFLILLCCACCKCCCRSSKKVKETTIVTEYVPPQSQQPIIIYSGSNTPAQQSYPPIYEMNYPVGSMNQWNQRNQQFQPTEQYYPVGTRNICPNAPPQYEKY